MYNDQFVSTVASPIWSKLLYYDSASGTEVHYACMDHARAQGLIDYAITTFNIPIPAFVLKIVSTVLLMVRIEGVMVMSGGMTVSAQVQTDMTTAIKGVMPKFTLAKDLFMFDKSTC